MIGPKLQPLLNRVSPIGCTNTDGPNVESLTSWLHRLAEANGYSGYIGMLRERPSLTFCVGNDVPYKLSKQVAQFQHLMNLPNDVLTKMHLNHPLSKLRGSDHLQLHYQWFVRSDDFPQLSRGSRHVICTQCINEAPIAFWRKTWRLSFWTVCPVHRVLMLQNCPRCMWPIFLNGKRIEYLHRCTECSESFHKDSHEPEDSAFEMPKYIYNIFAHTPEALPVKVTDVSQWWQGFRRLVGVVCFPKNASALMNVREHIPDRYHALLAAISEQPPLNFDGHAILIRHKVLCFVDWLLHAWPSRYVNLFAKAGIRCWPARTPDHFKPNWLTPRSLRTAMTVESQGIASIDATEWNP